jgi:translation initiation factor 2 beta subunit (eIF-2beta)/eIF-5
MNEQPYPDEMFDEAVRREAANRPKLSTSFGGLDVEAVNVLRLISELEGSSQLLKYMGFQEDMETLNEIKKKYYKLYFKLKKEESNPL